MCACTRCAQVYGGGLVLSLLAAALSAVGAQGSSVLFAMGAGLSLVVGYLLDVPVSPQANRTQASDARVHACMQDN